jgi:G:T-mismatch repair DNA endonuclease (very short patch repair protein)
MTDKLIKKIINEYQKGKSSVILSRELNIHKKTILRVLNKHGVIRKRNRCESLDIQSDGNFFIVPRKCPKCGGELITKSKDKIIACRNHFNKLNNNSLCKYCLSKSQNGVGNPFYGKKHTNESKDKISKSRKGKATGNENAMSNEIWRKKASENLKLKWNSGELESTRKIMSNHMKNTIRSGKIKSSITSKNEKVIIDIIKKLGYKAIQSFRVDTKICDVFIPDLNLIIEYFGDYWHCNPIKYDINYFNKKKNKFAWELWEYDKSKLDLVKSCGYNVEVIWEKQFRNNEQIIENIISKYDTKSITTPKRSRKD